MRRAGLEAHAQIERRSSSWSTRAWTEDSLGPAMAYIVADTLGMARAHCFDVVDACNGWSRALQLTESLFQSGTYSRAMLIASEFPMSRWCRVPRSLRLRSIDEVARSFAGYTPRRSGNGGRAVSRSRQRAAVSLLVACRSCAPVHGSAARLRPLRHERQPTRHQRRGRAVRLSRRSHVLGRQVRGYVAHSSAHPCPSTGGCCDRSARRNLMWMGAGCACPRARRAVRARFRARDVRAAPRGMGSSGSRLRRPRRRGARRAPRAST